jgi:glycosyltransferase involved in cell wall biosynthesis
MLENRKTAGYLLKTYPKLSETFILNEILELERQGISLHLFSLRKPTDEKNHPDVAKVKASVTYIPTVLPDFNFQDLISLLKVHWQLLSQSPRQYWQALQFHWQRPEKKRWNEFLQAGYLAATMQKLGLSHLQAHFANVPTATTEIAKIFGGFSYNIFAHAKDIYLTEAEVLDRRIASAEFVLTCTGFNHRYLQSISHSNTPIYLSYHGIDLTRFTSVFTQQKTEIPFILSVGRYCEKKGFPYLIEACRQLKQQGHKFQCDIVGYGPMQGELAQLIADLDVADVVSLAGKMTQDELVKVYQKASIFVLPCQVMDNGDRDGIPNVLLEAMAMEIPVVSTDISGISELVDSGKNGFLVTEKNPPALAEALEKLLSQPELREQFGKAGRQRVLQQFSLERNVGEIRELFDRTLNLTAIPSQETIKFTEKVEVKV